MTETNESVPLFVDVGGAQEQFPLQQGSFAVFTHLNKHLEQTVKQELTETLDQEVQQDTLNHQVEITPTVPTDQSTTIEFEFPLSEKQEAQGNDTPISNQNQTVATNQKESKCSATAKRLKCTEKTDGLACIYKTDTEDRLIRHIRKIHRGENPFQCTMCEYSTYNKALFEEHVRIHQGIKPFKCRICPYRSVSKKNTKKHELIHRPDNPLKCPQCEFIARHERSLQLHIQMHSGYVQCDLCEYKAKNPDSLRIHRRRHGAPEIVNNFACGNCDAKFADLRAVNNHKKKAKKCNECGIVLCTKILYNTHMVTEHQIATEGGKLFKCAVCGWKSMTKTRILLHLIHHPEQTVDEKLVDVTILKNFGIM